MALALFRLTVIFRYAVDIPLLDEWDLLGFLETNAQHIQWRSFFDFHNDHRIFFTRLIIYLEYLTTGWDIRHTSLVNYAFFLAMVAMLISICRPGLKKFPPYPLFFVPFFSDFVWINMAWSFQSSFHFMILFALCAIGLGLARPPTAGNTAGFVFFCGLSMFSLSPTCAIGVWSVYLLKHFSQMTRENWARNSAAMAVATGAIAALVLAFFSGYRGIHLNGQAGFHVLYPWNGRFWGYLSRTLANAFAGGGYDHLPGLAFLVAPAMGLLLLYALMNLRRRTEGLFPPLAVVAASLVSLAAISYGRGCMEPMACDRHMEVVLIAIPALLATGAAVADRRIARGGLLASLLLLLAGYSGYLVPREAGKMQRYVMAGKNEIIDFATGKRDRVDSGTLFRADLAPRVLRARSLNLSFTREIPDSAWSNRLARIDGNGSSLEGDSRTPNGDEPTSPSTTETAP